MKWTFTTLLAAVIVAALAQTACDMPKPPPSDANGDWVRRVKPADLGEVEAAQSMLNAMEVYKYRLKLLGEYYTRTGNYAKEQWVEQELRNIKRAVTFKYIGLKPAPVEAGPSLQEKEPGRLEVTLAEMVIDARRDWIARVDDLRAYYLGLKPGMGNPTAAFKAEMARSIAYRFDPVRQYEFFLDVEVPPETLKPTDSIDEADALYAKAHHDYSMASFLAPAYNYPKLKQALEEFQQLIRQYPSSTKIALAAFYVGQIYDDLGQDYRAMQWYERSWQYDPYLQRPAHFQSAVIADARLHNRGKALELYRAAVELEPFNTSNISYAQRRIYELTTEPDTRTPTK
jgi:TolA-binding protein